MGETGQRENKANSFSLTDTHCQVLWGYSYVAFNVFYVHPMFVGTLTGSFRGDPTSAVVLAVLYHIIVAL
jgi:hypothetical protein